MEVLFRDSQNSMQQRRIMEKRIEEELNASCVRITEAPIDREFTLSWFICKDDCDGYKKHIDISKSYGHLFVYLTKDGKNYWLKINPMDVSKKNSFEFTKKANVMGYDRDRFTTMKQQFKFSWYSYEISPQLLFDCVIDAFQEHFGDEDR